VKKLEGDKTLRKPRRRCVNNIKMDLKRRKDGWSRALSQNMGKLFNAIMHFNKADLSSTRWTYTPVFWVIKQRHYVISSQCIKG
jgi:hypothetical protein